MFWTLETPLAISIWVQTTRLNPTRMKIRQNPWVQMDLPRCFHNTKLRCLWFTLASHFGVASTLQRHIRHLHIIDTVKLQHWQDGWISKLCSKDYISLTTLFLKNAIPLYKIDFVYLLKRPLSFLFFVWREGKGKGAYLCKAWNRMSWPSVLPSALWRREGHGRCVRVRRVAFVGICCFENRSKPQETRFFNKWLQTSKHFSVFVALTSRCCGSLTWNSGELRWIAIIVTKMDSGFPSNRMSNQRHPVAAYHSTRMWQSSISLFAEMPQRAIAPNPIAFTAAMTSAEWRQAVQLLQD